nr:hypothetical protein [Tanacetum cinerariifolium]
MVVNNGDDDGTVDENKFDRGKENTVTIEYYTLAYNFKEEG